MGRENRKAREMNKAIVLCLMMIGCGSDPGLDQRNRDSYSRICIEDWGNEYPSCACYLDYVEAECGAIWCSLGYEREAEIRWVCGIERYNVGTTWGVE